MNISASTIIDQVHPASKAPVPQKPFPKPKSNSSFTQRETDSLKARLSKIPESKGNF